jgi:hypothetical protein
MDALKYLYACIDVVLYACDFSLFRTIRRSLERFGLIGDGGRINALEIQARI